LGVRSPFPKKQPFHPANKKQKYSDRVDSIEHPSQDHYERQMFEPENIHSQYPTVYKSDHHCMKASEDLLDEQRSNGHILHGHQAHLEFVSLLSAI
jgi:hypothetical protein